MEIKESKIKFGEYSFAVWHNNELMFKDRLGLETEHHLAQGMEMLLNRVYALGKQDGYLEGLREAK